MSLLFFSYLLAVFLFFFSYYLDSRAERIHSIFTSMAMTAAFIALFSGISANLLYFTDTSLSLFCLKIALSCLVLFSLLLLRYAYAIPYFPRTPLINVLSWVFVAFGVYLAFFHISSFSWTSIAGFRLTSTSFYGLVDGFRLFVWLYMIGIPGFAVLSMIIRAFGIRSRIYRQRLLFVAVSVCAGFFVSYTLFEASSRYFWLLPLVPFGLAVLLVLVYQSISLTTLFDRALVLATLTRFTILSLVISALAALGTALIIEFVPSQVAVSVILVFVTVFVLALQFRMKKQLKKYVRVGSDYEAELETGLDQIDYTSGGEKVITQTVTLLEKYVECSTVDILVSDDKGKLVTSFSSSNTRSEILVEDKAIDFLLNHNESIVVKTQAITNHTYAEVKPELLKLFDVGHSDAFILLREGHRVVGIILLGAKKRGADYTDYDYTVLSKLYSNFFLVMYYLKNIANESVVLTVDREIEFSGQIITSIQENIDRINHPKVDVDFITRSARKLGGDFIDFIKLADDKYLYVMGDVSGKGLNASMSMVILKSVLRTFLTETSDFKKLIVKVNLFIKNNLPKGTFFAGVFGLMDFSTNTMYYINCGVPAMFLYTASYNNAIEIQGDGKILGFVRDISKYLKVKKIVLNPQDIILMTTDGLVDSTNLRGERFGKDRVQRMLMDNRTYPAGRMAQFLCESLEDFVSRELEDDITVLVFKYLNK